MIRKVKVIEMIFLCAVCAVAQGPASAQPVVSSILNAASYDAVVSPILAAGPNAFSQSTGCLSDLQGAPGHFVIDAQNNPFVLHVWRRDGDPGGSVDHPHLDFHVLRCLANRFEGS